MTRVPRLLSRIAIIFLAVLCLSSLSFQIVGEGEDLLRRLSVPAITTERGQFTIPVELSEGGGIVAVQFGLFFESAILELVEVLPGSLLTDHDVVLNTTFQGNIGAAIVSRNLTAFQPGPGSVLEIVFRNVADEDAELDIFGAVASGTGGSIIEIEARPTIALPFTSLPILDARGLVFLFLVLLGSGLALLRKGIV